MHHQAWLNFWKLLFQENLPCLLPPQNPHSLCSLLLDLIGGCCFLGEGDIWGP
jgi:hypothetical protein